jgi:CheY-like chemotaxis protein
VADCSAQALKIKRYLENYGCRVYFTTAGGDSLVRTCHKYFDFIILDVDRADEQGWGVYQTVKSYPQLANIPVAVLARCESSGEAINKFQKVRVYLPAKDASAIAMLLQMIYQVHYLTYRYL